MTRFACLVFFSVLPLLCSAADQPSALKALKALPKGVGERLARIEAHDGTPEPMRWHFLVYDRKSESGVKEYVVAAGELVASRGVSQFADKLTKEDVIGTKVLRVDSDKLAQLAMEYAAANDVEIAKLNYQLLKEGAESQPKWRINCIDNAEQVFGILVVTAAKGNVVSHDGFPVQPEPHEKAEVAKVEFETDAESLIAAEAANQEVAEEAASEEDSAAEDPALVTKSEGAVNSRTKTSAPSVVTNGGGGNRKQASVSRSNSSRQKVSRRSTPVIRPVKTVRKVTRPVRRIVRTILPF